MIVRVHVILVTAFKKIASDPLGHSFRDNSGPNNNMVSSLGIHDEMTRDWILVA